MTPEPNIDRADKDARNTAILRADYLMAVRSHKDAGVFRRRLETELASARLTGYCLGWAEARASQEPTA